MNSSTTANRAWRPRTSDAEYIPQTKLFYFGADQLGCEIGIPREVDPPLRVILYFDTANRYTMVTKAFLSRTRIGVKFYDLKETIEWGRHTYQRIAEFDILLGLTKCSVSAVILEEDTSPWLAMGTEDLRSKKIDLLFSSQQIRFADGCIAHMNIQGSNEILDTYSYGSSRLDAREACEERPESAGGYDSDGTFVELEDGEITVGIDDTPLL